MLATNIESKVEEILKKKGKGGWLRVAECAKEYGLDPSTGERNASRETKFYRWRKQVEKGKVEGFRILKLSGNISFIGLDSANPQLIKSFMVEDKEILRSVKSGLGFFDWLERRAERKERENLEREARIDARLEAICSPGGFTDAKFKRNLHKHRRKYGLE
jgi:hypothetical protein